MKRIAVISSWSFFHPGARVGTQFLAQILARAGYDVHYFGHPSSPLDVLGRWPRFRRAWLDRPMTREVEPRLLEHFPRAPFPVHPAFWRTPRQVDWYGAWLPARLKRTPFDLCIHDVSMSFPLMEHLRSKAFVLRLSDHPEGFTAASPYLRERLLQNLDGGRYAQVWAASQPLFDWLQRRRPEQTQRMIPNGVDVERFALSAYRPEPRSAIFVGSLERWVDWELLAEAARRLPDWRLDIFGPGGEGLRRQFPGLRFQGAVAYAELPSLLSRYQVGLIPFRSGDRLIEMMERPLKFYEYLAAGLGIAATDAGGLRAGMTGWAQFGSGGASFAEAIVRAGNDAGTQREARLAYLRDFSWPHLGAQIVDIVQDLEA